MRYRSHRAPFNAADTRRISELFHARFRTKAPASCNLVPVKSLQRCRRPGKKTNKAMTTRQRAARRAKPVRGTGHGRADEEKRHAMRGKQKILQGGGRRTSGCARRHGDCAPRTAVRSRGLLQHRQRHRPRHGARDPGRHDPGPRRRGGERNGRCHAGLSRRQRQRRRADARHAGVLLERRGLSPRLGARKRAGPRAQPPRRLPVRGRRAGPWRRALPARPADAGRDGRAAARLREVWQRPARPRRTRVRGLARRMAGPVPQRRPCQPGAGHGGGRRRADRCRRRLRADRRAGDAAGLHPALGQSRPAALRQPCGNEKPVRPTQASTPAGPASASVAGEA